MKTIKQILDNKGRDVFTIDPESSAIDAVKNMASRKIGALIVLQEGRVVGVFTEQDFTRRVLLKERDSKTTVVGDVMSGEVTVLTPDQTINEGMAVMTEKRIRHLPVIVDGELIGLISIGDLVKEVISEQGQIIEQLEQYINT